MSRTDLRDSHAPLSTGFRLGSAGMHPQRKPSCLLRVLLRGRRRLPDHEIVSDQRADHQRRTNELDWLEMMSLRDPNHEHGDRNEVDE
jgi:hypothetical protein